MTDIEINIAIAKALGIKVVSDGISHNLMPCDFGGAYNPDGVSLTFIPDCCNDLNVMHVVEKELIKRNLYQDYWPTLEHITGSSRLAHATARQKAEAFLRTINKWVA